MSSESPNEQPYVECTLAELEKRHILATLVRCGGNKTHAAQKLGVSLKTLYNKLNLYAQASEDSNKKVE